MEPITAVDYGDVVQVESPAVSPDGETVAFVRKDPESDEEYEQTVYLAPADGRAAPRRFTASEGVDAEPTWSPSGDRLAFVSDRGSDDGVPQLRVVPADGGESRKVTDVVGGVSSIAFSPDGTRVAFTQSVRPEEREAGHDLAADEDYEREDPDPRVVDRMIYRAAERYFDGGRSHVYVVDLESADVTRVTEGDRDFQFPAWADDDHLYYAVKRGAEPDDSIEYTVERAPADGSGDPEEVTTTTDWGPRLATSDDGRLAFPRTPEEQASMRQTDVVVHDPETGEETVVTAGLDRTLSGDRHLTWDGEDLLFHVPDEGAYTVRRAVGGGTDLETVVDSGHVSQFDAAGGTLAVARSEWDHRGDVFATPTAGGDLTRLSEVNADYLAERHVGEPEELWFENGEGEEVQGWVLTPPDFSPEETYPLVVEIHGGPHGMWTTSGTMWHEFQTLAAAGYVVFWSNPRGSTGYGEAFATAIERDWGAVTATDVLAGADEVAARDYVDEGQQFVTGGSFGGFMTAWLVGNTDRFAAAVPQRGVYDLSSFYGSTDAFKLIEGDFDTTPWDEPAFLWEQSPVGHVEGVDTPTLVIHADNDFRVPVNNGEMLYLFLRKQGVDTRLVRYPREGHELSRSGEPGHVVDRLERIRRWFDGYSEYHDAPRALDRPDDEGLSGGIRTDEEESEDEE